MPTRIKRRALTDTIFSDLFPLLKGDQQVWDTLAGQPLRTYNSDHIEPTASGKRQPLSGPSIDAGCPWCAALKIKQSTIIFVTFALYWSPLNRMFGHYPKFLMFPIHDMVTTKDEDVYLNAVAVFRVAYTNQAEMQPFSFPSQSHRLGLDCPSNFSETLAVLGNREAI